MDELVVSSFLRVLIGRLKSLNDDNASKYHFQDALARLLPLAEFIDDAEERQRTDPAVFDWLKRLQEALCKVDVLIDELQILSRNKHQNQLEKKVYIPSTSLKALVQVSEFAHHLGPQAIRSCLYEITRDANNLGFRRSAKFTNASRRTTSNPYLCRSEIFGRREEKDQAIDFILKSAAEFQRVAVLSIVGIGGIGKTTVAQLVYNDWRICDNFDIRLWVNVGMNTDITGILDQMSMQDESAEYPKALKDLFSKKRVFLVLDNLWGEGSLVVERVWREIVDAGSQGCAITVTSRMSSVSYTFRSLEIYLYPLTEESSYFMFETYVFGSYGFETQPELRDFAKVILKLCSGHPMILKMVGTYLYNKNDVQQWTEVIEILQGDKFDVIRAVLRFMYDKLPSYLKLPFCTFSLQNDLSVEELICMWMALGFLYSDDPTQQPEYIGRKYLKELAESSLFLDVEYAPGGIVRHLTVHDLVYDLAVHKASEQGFLMYDQSFRKTHRTSRYVVWDDDSKPDGRLPTEMILIPREVRLFMLFIREQASTQLISNIVSGFKCLRVLGLGGCDIEILPDSIGKLKHLRYLDVGRNARMKRLPDSICNLWHLQTLFLHGCDQLYDIPVNIGWLQNLMYLTLTTLQESLPEEIGQLTSLRTLGLANCLRLASLPSSVKNLKNLQTLAFVDCPQMDLLASSSVEGFKGMNAIDTLLLAGLPKFEFLPPDLGIFSVVMKHLSVQSCTQLTETACIYQFRSLHSLTIEGCPQLSSLAMNGTIQFNNMSELVIRNCPSLGSTTWIRQFVSLRSLIIGSCRNLVALDIGFSELSKLERVEIRWCPELIKRIQTLGGVDSHYISHVRVVELDGRRLPRLRRLYGNLKKYYHLSNSGSRMKDVATTSNHVISNNISAEGLRPSFLQVASEIAEDDS